MAKLVLGAAPANFDLPVKVPTPQGEGDITFVAKHLTSTEWAKLRDSHDADVKASVDSIFAAARKAAEAEHAAGAQPKRSWLALPQRDEDREREIEALIKQPTNEQLERERTKNAATLIGKITTGWDLEEPHGQAALERMCDLYRAAPKAVFDAYNDALEGRRLGN